MRLFEVEDRFASDLEMVLRNQMGRSNSTKSTLAIPFAGINNLIKNMGYGAIDRHTLQQMVDANPSLSKLIKNIEDEEVIINTKAANPEADDDAEALSHTDAKSVDQMASSGAADALNNPLA